MSKRDKILALIVTLIIAGIPLVMAYGAMTEKVNNLDQTTDNHSEKIDVLENIAAGTEVSLQSIQDDISEIKQDIRDVKNELITRRSEE